MMNLQILPYINTNQLTQTIGINRLTSHLAEKNYSSRSELNLNSPRSLDEIKYQHSRSGHMISFAQLAKHGLFPQQINVLQHVPPSDLEEMSRSSLNTVNQSGSSELPEHMIDPIEIDGFYYLDMRQIIEAMLTPEEIMSVREQAWSKLNKKLYGITKFAIPSPNFMFLADIMPAFPGTRWFPYNLLFDIDYGSHLRIEKQGKANIINGSRKNTTLRYDIAFVANPIKGGEIVWEDGKIDQKVLAGFDIVYPGKEYRSMDFTFDREQALPSV